MVLVVETKKTLLSTLARPALLLRGGSEYTKLTAGHFREKKSHNLFIMRDQTHKGFQTFAYKTT